MNEEDVDNTLVESPISFLTRPTVLSKLQITYPTDISSDEEEEESDNESEYYPLNWILLQQNPV